MVNAGILDKDYLIVRKQNTAMNGEIVAVLLEDEATVKRFFKKANSIKLMPENDFMEPIEVKDAKDNWQGHRGNQEILLNNMLL